MFEDEHKWKCQITRDLAHHGSVCALATLGNQLYSSSNKSLKIWDLETVKCISDISAHSTFIKVIKLWPEQSLMLTASEKTILLWD